MSNYLATAREYSTGNDVMFEPIRLKKVADMETAPKQGMSIFHQRGEAPASRQPAKELGSRKESKLSSSCHDDVSLPRRSYQALKSSLEYRSNNRLHGKKISNDNSKRQLYKSRRDLSQDGKESAMERGDGSAGSTLDANNLNNMNA